MLWPLAVSLAALVARVTGAAELLCLAASVAALTLAWHCQN